MYEKSRFFHCRQDGKCKSHADQSDDEAFDEILEQLDEPDSKHKKISHQHELSDLHQVLVIDANGCDD